MELYEDHAHSCIRVYLNFGLQERRAGNLVGHGHFLILNSVGGPHPFSICEIFELKSPNYYFICKIVKQNQDL